MERFIKSYENDCERISEQFFKISQVINILIDDINILKNDINVLENENKKLKEKNKEMKEKNEELKNRIDHCNSMTLELSNQLKTYEFNDSEEYCGIKYKKSSEPNENEVCGICKKLKINLCFDCTSQMSSKSEYTSSQMSSKSEYEKNNSTCKNNIKCLIVLLDCTHSYHLHCFQHWFFNLKKEVCPICNWKTSPSKWTITK